MKKVVVETVFVINKGCGTVEKLESDARR